MVTVVVPFRGATAKSRLGRPEVAHAMLEDVVAAAQAVGAVVVANGDGGQGAAVAAALSALEGHVVVVNADVPCVTSADLDALVAATPRDGMAIVAAADGTTNALSLAHPRLFAPLYGPDSARRFRERGAADVNLPNVAHDVDTWADLVAVADRVGPHTRAALEA